MVASKTSRKGTSSRSSGARSPAKSKQDQKSSSARGEAQAKPAGRSPKSAAAQSPQTGSKTKAGSRDSAASAQGRSRAAAGAPSKKTAAAAPKPRSGASAQAREKTPARAPRQGSQKTPGTRATKQSQGAAAGSARSAAVSELKKTAPQDQPAGRRVKGAASAAKVKDQSAPGALARGQRRGSLGDDDVAAALAAKPLVAVVSQLDDTLEGEPTHPLSEMIAVTEAKSAPVSETFERDGRIVAADFGILDLHPGVREALARVNYTKPTEVQALCLPHTIEGKDVAGFAQTGTGKTAVFLITAAHRILTESLQAGERGQPAVLVLVPTRELAAQIEAEAATLFDKLSINTLAIFGGSADIDKQTRALSKKVDVVVATPGRLFDLHRQGVIHFGSVGLLVCDEADRMLDMGFIEDVEQVLRLVPEASQKMFFSATGSERVHELAFEYLNDPEYIETTPEQITPERITQWCYAIRAEEKFAVLLSSIRTENPACAIVFTNTKVAAEWVAYKLACNGIHAEALTGDIPQTRRMALIKQIKNQELKVLVATDVLSRGLHVPGLSHVYNFDVPEEAESFIHRIGRTARAGAHGSAITLVCEDYGYNMGAVEELLGFAIPVRPVEAGFIEVEDRSDFPFDSSGRVKSFRDRKSGDSRPTPVAPGAVSARPEQDQEPSRPRAADRIPQDRDGERSRRDGRGERPREPFAKEARGPGGYPPREAVAPEASAMERGPRRTDVAPDRSFAEPRVVRDGERAPRRSDTPVFDQESGPIPSSRSGWREDRRPQPETKRTFSDQDSEVGRLDRRETPEGRRSAGEAPARNERSRDSKFVRRDERAKEVIEAALLAAARERELQSLSTLRGSGDEQRGSLGAEWAKGAAGRLADGLLGTLRRAAPGLGGWLKRVGQMLEAGADSAPSVVSEIPSPETAARTNRPQQPRGPQVPRSHERAPEAKVASGRVSTYDHTSSGNDDDDEDGVTLNAGFGAGGPRPERPDRARRSENDRERHEPRGVANRRPGREGDSSSAVSFEGREVGDAQDGEVVFAHDGRPHRGPSSGDAGRERNHQGRHDGRHEGRRDGRHRRHDGRPRR